MNDQDTLNELKSMKCELEKSLQLHQISAVAIYSLRKKAEMQLEKINELADRMMSLNGQQGSSVSELLEKINRMISDLEKR
jgi:PDZ domain-containing secreted protein